MPADADKDWTTPAARAELAALHAQSTRGDGGWNVTEGQAMAYRVVAAGCVVATLDRLAADTDRRNAACIAADHNALPALLARIERDEALLARVPAVLLAVSAPWGPAPDVDQQAVAHLLLDLHGAGHDPPGGWSVTDLADLRAAAGFAPEGEE